jgi:hypothetical protein
VQKFICKEPAEIKAEFKPVNPLTKCKACNASKRYGAYYNAAAHLRRAHFVPKQRGRGKSKLNNAKTEKRGGKGGGDWPPMSELKRWMEPFMEKADPETSSQPQEEDEEDETMEWYDEDLTRLIDSNVAFDDVVCSGSMDFDLSDSTIPVNIEQFNGLPSGMQSMQHPRFDASFGLPVINQSSQAEVIMTDVGHAVFPDGWMEALAFTQPSFPQFPPPPQDIDIQTGPMDQWY